MLDPVEKIRPLDVPLSPDISAAELDWLVAHPVFERLDPKFRSSDRFRKSLQTHSRLVQCEDGDIIVREGDWGNSAFLVLKGEVAVEVEPPGEFLAAEGLGRRPLKRMTLFESFAQLWRNHRYPEYRDVRRYAADSQSMKIRDNGNQAYFQDVPRLLDDFRTVRLREGELFGELAALGRTARSATVFAVSSPTLLEIRWAGMRSLMKGDAGMRKRIDEKFRENALGTFLLASPLLKNFADDDEVLDQLVRDAHLRTFGEYDDVGSTFKQLADEGVSSNLTNEPLIAEEGHYPNGVTLIRSGVARLSRRHHHGHQTVSYLTPGKVFGFEEIAEGWRTGQSVPLKYSLRAIGFLSAVVIPTPLVEKHLLQKSIVPSPAARASQAVTASAVTASADTAAIDPDTMEFLVGGGFVNGTATMLINLDRCTRCDDCVRACAATHDNNPRFLRQGPSHGSLMVARACMHCQDPVCMIECPTGAISRQLEQGEVTINDLTCIGCATCAKNCPYEAIRIVEVRDKNGQFIRAAKDRKPIPKATKCDLCVDQLGGPSCQRACPHDALMRTDMGDVDSLAKWLNR